MARKLNKTTAGYNSTMQSNNSAIGRKSAIINRSQSMIRANMANQGKGNFMKNYNRIVNARNNMLRTSQTGLVSG